MDQLISTSTGKAGESQKLMVSGLVCLEGQEGAIEIQRGARLYSREGELIGKVAAVVIDRPDRLASELIIFRLPGVRGYWRLPNERVVSVDNGEVWLDLSTEEVEQLDAWHAGQ